MMISEEQLEEWKNFEFKARRNNEVDELITRTLASIEGVKMPIIHIVGH